MYILGNVIIITVQFGAIDMKNSDVIQIYFVSQCIPLW